MMTANASDILSVVAIVVSIGTFVVTFIQERHNSKRVLKSEYFQSIFKDHLTKRIPESRAKIYFDKGFIYDSYELAESVNKLRQDAKYFLYSDKQFYENLKEKIQALEDKAVTAQNQTFSSTAKNEYLRELDKHISDVYHFIEKRQFGS